MRPSSKDILRCLKAMAHPVRFQILDLLQTRPRCVCDLAKELGLAQPSVSNHLSLMEGAGLLKAKRMENRKEYSLRPRDQMARGLVSLVLREAFTKEQRPRDGG